MMGCIRSGMGNFGPGGPLPYTEFSFNQKLIKVFRINRKLQTGDFFSGLELNSEDRSCPSLY